MTQISTMRGTNDKTKGQSQPATIHCVVCQRSEHHRKRKEHKICESYENCSLSRSLSLSLSIYLSLPPSLSQFILSLSFLFPNLILFLSLILYNASLSTDSFSSFLSPLSVFLFDKIRTVPGTREYRFSYVSKIVSGV